MATLVQEKPNNLGSLVVANFNWGQNQLASVAYFAEGRYSAADIARATGESYSTIRRWKSHPEFQAKIDELQAQMLEKFNNIGMARKEGRIRTAQDRLQRIQDLIEERAAAADPLQAETFNIQFDQELAQTPGGSTGLLAKKIQTAGQNAYTTYEVDTSLLKAEQEISKQLAIELGQYTEKTENTRVQKLYIGIDLDMV